MLHHVCTEKWDIQHNDIQAGMIVILTNELGTVRYTTCIVITVSITN